MVQYGRGDNMKIISTLLIVSLLFVPSLDKGGKNMASSKYNPITGNTYNYNDSGQLVSIDTGRDTTRGSSGGSSGGSTKYTNLRNNNVWMKTPEGQLATVRKDAADKYLEKGWELSDDIYYSSNDVPHIKPDSPFHKNYGNSSGSIDYAAQLAQQRAQYEAQLRALKQAQYEARANALKAQKNRALSSLDTEKSTISPMYYDKRNQAAGQSDIGALNFAQFMASRGVQGSAGAMPEVYRNAALQGQIGALNQQEASDLSGIENRRSDITRAYETDLAAAKADTEAQALQAIIEQQRIDQQNALEQQRYDATQAKAADVTAYKRLEDRKAAYAATVGQFSGDYQAEINRLASSDDPDKEWKINILAAARQKKIDDAMAKYQKQGYVSEDIAAALGLEVGTMTDAYKAQQESAAAKQQVDNAIKMFAQLGYLTPEMVQILKAYGLTQDDITRLYKNQTTGGGGEEKPWYLQ